MAPEKDAASQIIRTLAVPRSNVRVDIAFFDEEEERKLRAYPTAAKILEIVTNGIAVPPAEFLTYYLFYRKRPGKKDRSGDR
jgi:hypothetical protein